VHDERESGRCKNKYTNFCVTRALAIFVTFCFQHVRAVFTSNNYVLTKTEQQNLGHATPTSNGMRAQG
jgi:hypothetical protein